MQTITITKFRKMCNEITPASYIFDTDNQPTRISKHIHIISRYYSVVFMLCPNRICFKNDNETLCFDGVRKIEYCESENSSEYVFKIICNSLMNDEEDASYIILADKF